MNFGEKVRELREAKGLSQVELGRLIGDGNILRQRQA